MYVCMYACISHIHIHIRMSIYSHLFYMHRKGSSKKQANARKPNFLLLVDRIVVPRLALVFSIIRFSIQFVCSLFYLVINFAICLYGPMKKILLLL